MFTRTTIVSQKPLILLLETGGDCSGTPERAIGLSETITKLKEEYPEKTFQLIPFRYGLYISNMTSGGSSTLTAILAVEN